MKGAKINESPNARRNILSYIPLFSALLCIELSIIVKKRFVYTSIREYHIYKKCIIADVLTNLTRYF